MAETWLLNDNITLPGSKGTTYTFAFISNSESFTGILNNEPELMYTSSGGSTSVYSTRGGWMNDAYKTIVLSENASGDALTWLTANGAKQASASRVSADITQLTGWAAWYATAATGSYELKVKAKANGYIDSDLSAPATLYIDSVTIDGANLAEYEGVVKILRGTAYSYTFATISSNYTFTGVTPTVKIGGTAYTGFTWNASTGKLDIPASGVTGSIAITLKAVGKSFAVTNDFTNCTSNGAATAQYYTDYIATITANTGYSLSAEGAVAPVVKVGGSTISTATWIPDGVGNSGTLTIPGSAITGAVTISCTAGAKQYVTSYNLTGCTTSSPETHTSIADVTMTFLRSTGYSWDSVVPTVLYTPDGSSDSIGITDQCTWTLPSAGFDTATLVVPKAYAAGRLDITITLAKQQYSVTKNATNCTIAGADTAEYNVNWTGTVNPTGSYELPGTVTVTIGGTTQTAGTQYTWNAASGTLQIKGQYITGDIVITVVATSRKLATPQNVTVDGTTASWDEVESATSYELYVDGTSIGTRSTTSYKVTTYNANHVTLSNYGPAVKGVNFVTTLQPYVGYSAPEKSGVSVKIGGTAFTSYDYTLDSTTGAGTLNIPAANVTGDIVISGDGKRRSKWKISIVPQNAKDGWYVTTERYVQGVLTTVHLNDGDNMYNGEKLTYYAEAKPGYETTRGATVVSGDVVVSNDITVTFKFPNNASYPVSAHMTGLTFAGASMATHGTNYTATITPASGYTLPSTVAVTIGGNNYTGHTWNSSTGALTIPGADIIGAIVVTATA